MALISSAVLLTLTDKHHVKAEPLPANDAKNFKNAGSVFAVLSVCSLIAGLIWGTSLFGQSLAHVGFHSIFMMTFLLAFMSLIMFTNGVSVTKDVKAYDFQPELFKTDKTFLLGASGIVVIIVALYAYFW